MNWSMNAILGGTVMLTAATVILTKLKLISQTLMRMIGLVQVKVYGQASLDISMLLNSQFTKSPFGVKTYNSVRIFVKPCKRHQNVAYEELSTAPTVFWRGWRPMLVSRVVPAQQSNDYNNTTMTFFRGTFDADSLLIEAMDLGNNVQNGLVAGRKSRFHIRKFVGSDKSMGAALKGLAGNRSSERMGESPHPTSVGDVDALATLMSGRPLKWNVTDLGDNEQRKNALDLIALPPEGYEFVKEFEHWLNSRVWYETRELAWKRGWLFTGLPGSGKSALARAIAIDYDVPIGVFDLGSMSNSELREAWNDFMGMTPAIALIEDIDRVFEGSKNITNSAESLSLDCLLNTLSGVEPNNGVFVIVTTNRPEVLDPALGVPRAKTGAGATLSTRPGRIDRVLHLNLVDEPGRYKIANRILTDCPHLIEEVVATGEGDTGAQFVSRCATVADDWHWNNTKHTEYVAQELNDPYQYRSDRERSPVPAVSKSSHFH